jgi:WD40 repeat protein
MQPSNAKPLPAGSLPDIDRGIAPNSDENSWLWDQAVVPVGARERRDYDYEQTLSGHRAPIQTTALLQDGRLVTGSVDATLIVWRASTKEDYQRFKSEIDKQLAHLLSPSFEGDMRTYWEAKELLLRQRLVLAELRGHEKAIVCTASASNGRLVSASEDGTLRIWLERLGGSTWESDVLCGHTGAIRCMHILDDNRIVSGAIDGTLRLWTEQSPRSWSYKTLLNHTSSVDAVDSFPNGDLLACCADGTLHVLRRSTEGFGGSVVAHGNIGSGIVKALANDRFISVAPDSASLFWLNSETGVWSCSVLEGLSHAQILPGTGVVAFAEDNSLGVWRCREGGDWEKIASRRDWRDLQGLAVTPCGRIILRTCWMDEGSNRRDVEILLVTADGNLTCEGSFTSKGAEFELRDHALSDGRLGITRKDGTIELYNWRTLERTTARVTADPAHTKGGKSLLGGSLRISDTLR